MSSNPAPISTPKPYPHDVEIALNRCAERIRTRMARTADDIFNIGLDLIEARKHVLENKRNFEAWLALEFQMSKAHAYKFIRIAERFSGDKSIQWRRSGMSVQALLELAGPSTSEEVVIAVKQMAEQGKAATAKEIAELKRQAAEAEEAKKAATEAKARVEELEATVAAQEVAKAKLEGAASSVDGLKKTNKDLREKLKDTNDELTAAKKEQVIRTEPDLEPLWAAFIAHWRALPMELRERFWAECPTPYAVPRSAMNGTNGHAQDDEEEHGIGSDGRSSVDPGDESDGFIDDDGSDPAEARTVQAEEKPGPTSENGCHLAMDQELPPRPAALEKNRGTACESVRVVLRTRGRTPTPLSAASPDAAITTSIPKHGISQEEWDALEIPAPFRR